MPCPILAPCIILAAAACGLPRTGLPQSDAGGFDFFFGPRVADAGSSDCRSYTPPRAIATLQSEEITEASGIVASPTQPGVFYVHNDSGDRPRFFAIDTSGALRAELRLAGVLTAVDVEDIDLGPCGEERCVYLGDVGDNSRKRPSYVVYRTREPTLVPGASSGPTDVTVEAFPFTYPDGSHNAETLLVHPTTGAVYVVTKTEGQSGVYRFPALTPGQSVTLSRVGAIALPEPFDRLITAGNIHPLGHRLLLRTYGHVYELRGEPGEPFETLLARPLVSVAAPAEPQGEAISYLPDGQGFVTISEGVRPSLFQSTCR